MSADGNGLTAKSWVTLVIFLVVVTCVIRPLRVKVPDTVVLKCKRFLQRARLIDPDDADAEKNTVVKPFYLHLSLQTAPVCGVLLLLASTIINRGVLHDALAGNNGIRPYDVLSLFIVLAYMSMLLDATGLLRSIAFWVANHGGPSGPRLYLYLYILFFVCGTFFGNDPAILSGTPFLAYFTQASLISHKSWVLSEFWSANVASAILVSSNPTNLLFAGAFDLNFLTEYTKYTVLPSIVCGIMGYVLLYLFFTIKKYDDAPAPAPKHITAQDEEATPIDTPTRSPEPQPNNASALEEARDPTELPPPALAPEYIPDAPEGKRPFIPKILYPPNVSPRSALVDPQGAIFHGTLMTVTLFTVVGTTFVPDRRVSVWMIMVAAGGISIIRELIFDIINFSKTNSKRKREEDQNTIASGTEKARKPLTLQRMLSNVQRRFPRISKSIMSLPIAVIIFAISMFILVRALVHVGWIPIFAKWLAKIATSPAKCAFFVGFMGSIFLCPLFGTNIGATILVVQILLDDNFLQSEHVLADPRIKTAAIFSAAMASNIGALSLAFSSSLAGMLWRSILEQRGIPFRQRDFALWNFVPVVLIMTVSNALVLMECYYF